MDVEEDARRVTPEYLVGALSRAIMLLEGAADQHTDYHNHWLRVDAQCLRIMVVHLQNGTR